MSDRDLQHIQALQFHDLPAANRLLKEFLKTVLPFEIEEVEARPLAVSLNSINGFILTGDGQKLFFKTHIEPDSIIDEYYNSSILAEAGYPVIQPIFSSTEYGKQLLVYEYFDYPSLFDVLEAMERGQGDEEQQAQIIEIQRRADQQLWEIYAQTLTLISAGDNVTRPIHQLFYHRLTAGRYHDFYGDKWAQLPQHHIPFAELAQLTWVINGHEFNHTLGQLITMATERTNPQVDTVAVVGHGDAHNGNIFLDQPNGKLIYFDPAFAGSHSPFLDLTKPLFHNVFARWMYFPELVKAHLNLSYTIEAGYIYVDHDFVPISPRQAILNSKVELALKPLVQLLRDRGDLPPSWLQDLKLALFCCPFLTMNLINTDKFSPEITLLGLAIAMEMGSSIKGGQELTLMDQALFRCTIAP